MKVSYFLDLNHNDEVWGFQLPCGVFVKKTLGIKDEVPYHKYSNTNSTKHAKIKKHVEEFIFADIRGKLPVKEVMTIDKDAEDLFEATVQILNDNKIQADGCHGVLWCDEDNRGDAYRYHLSLKCCIRQCTNYSDEKKERLAFSI